MMTRFAVAAIAALIATAPVQAAPVNVTFGSLVGSVAPFTVGTGAGAVTFSSTALPGTFLVGSTSGLFSGFSTGLGDFSSFSGDPLTITFGSATTAPLSIAFGIEDAFGSFGSDFLTITPNVGAGQTAPTKLDSLAFAEPEGTAVINAGVTSFTITSANPFAIGNVTSVPEPISLSLLAGGLAGVVAFRRRA